VGAERWRAVSRDGTTLGPDRAVRVVGVRDLTLVVEAAD
jgi:membrane-bound ClpP family serine protease